MTFEEISKICYEKNLRLEIIPEDYGVSISLRENDGDFMTTQFIPKEDFPNDFGKYLLPRMLEIFGIYYSKKHNLTEDELDVVINKFLRIKNKPYNRE